MLDGVPLGESDGGRDATMSEDGVDDGALEGRFGSSEGLVLGTSLGITDGCADTLG